MYLLARLVDLSEERRLLLLAGFGWDDGVVSVEFNQILFDVFVALGEHFADVKLPLTHLTNITFLIILVLRIDSLLLTTPLAERVSTEVAITCILV